MVMKCEFCDSPKFNRGRNGEQLVAKMLQNEGFFIVPSYDYSGKENDKAPKMQGKLAGFILPDLDACRNGTRRWVEVKTKTEATFTRKTGQYEHGIPLRHYEHYRRVQEISGCPVWLFVYEERTRVVLWQKLDDLGLGRIYDGPRMSYGGMIFWPRGRFRTAKVDNMVVM